MIIKNGLFFSFNNIFESLSFVPFFQFIDFCFGFFKFENR